MYEVSMGEGRAGAGGDGEGGCWGWVTEIVRKGGIDMRLVVMKGGYSDDSGIGTMDSG